MSFAGVRERARGRRGAGRPAASAAGRVVLSARNEEGAACGPALAYNVSHAARVLMVTASGEGWSLMRLRERVLRVAARVLVHGRRATLVIGKASAALWHGLWSQLITWRYAET